MKRLVNLLSVCVLLVGVSGVANATIIDYSFAVDGSNNYTSPFSGVTVYTFDGGPALSWSGNGDVVTGSVASLNAAPYGVSAADATHYITVPKNIGTTPLSITATFGPGAAYNYFGLWWGSVDTYNTLTFLYNGSVVETITGAAIPTSHYGVQTDPTANLYVNFLDLPLFNSFTMTSSNYAFEADNIAVGKVPEPTTLLLFGLGLLGLAGLRRRFKK